MEVKLAKERQAAKKTYYAVASVLIQARNPPPQTIVFKLLTESVYKVVLQRLILTQIRQLILDISNSRK